MLHLEPFLDAAIASLQAGLPAAIATENGRNTDFQIPTPDPSRILFGGEQAIVAYPTVEVAAPDAEMSDMSVGQQDWDLAVTVIVRGWLQNDAVVVGYAPLYRATMRMARSILNVLVAPNAFGDSSTIQRVTAAYRVFEAREELTAATSLTFRLLDVEVPG